MDYKTGHRGYSIPMVASSVNKSIHNTWAVERNSNATVKLFLNQLSRVFTYYKF